MTVKGNFLIANAKGALASTDPVYYFAGVL